MKSTLLGNARILFGDRYSMMAKPCHDQNPPTCGWPATSTEDWTLKRPSAHPRAEGVF